MLINFSNHPVEKWQQEQVIAAEAMAGPVFDWPFPNIPSRATAEEVARMADDYFQRICQYLRTEEKEMPNAVHIMGEMTFTFALVRRLLDAGIRCVASTTERLVIDNPDGTKTTKFSFVRFRDYAL